MATSSLSQSGFRHGSAQPAELAQLAAQIPDLPAALLAAPDHPFVAPGMSADPFAHLGPIRDKFGIVLRGPDDSYAGERIYNVFGHDLSKPHAMALSHAAVSAIAMAPNRFRNALAYGAHETVQGHTVNCTDGEEHRFLRAALDTMVFGRKPMERWVGDIVEPTAHFLVARLASKLQAGETCDFRRDVALPMAFRSIAAIIGIPASGIAFFVKSGEIAQSAPRHPEAAAAAVAEMNDYFWALLELRKAEPTNDLMSLLLTAADNGARMSDASVVDHCRFLVPGGIETTWRQAANVVFALLEHPEQYGALVAKPALIEAAIEEGIRWMPSANIVPRIAAEDSEVAGVQIASGTAILNMLGIANRDPARWENPDAFDISRPLRRHLTFHAGIHHCIGHILARAIIRSVLTQCVAQLPALRLAAQPGEIRMHGFVIRCPEAMPVALQ